MLSNKNVDMANLMSTTCFWNKAVMTVITQVFIESISVTSKQFIT